MTEGNPETDNRHTGAFASFVTAFVLCELFAFLSIIPVIMRTVRVNPAVILKRVAGCKSHVAGMNMRRFARRGLPWEVGVLHRLQILPVHSKMASCIVIAKSNRPPVRWSIVYKVKLLLIQSTVAL